MTMLNDFLSTSATWGVLLTLAAFALGTLINHKTGKAVFNPLLLGTVFVIVFLSVCGIPYASYKASASPVNYLLLPATVSLAVPLYEKWDLLRKNVLAIVMGILAGTLASLGSVLVLSLLLRLDHSQYITLLPKSVTTAISMDVSKELGGIAALTRRHRHPHRHPGCPHGRDGLQGLPHHPPHRPGHRHRHRSPRRQGTSKALQMGEVEGAMSGLAVAVAGVMTAILCPVFSSFIS